MVRRGYVQGGERQLLADRLRWHIQRALHHDGVSAVLILRPLDHGTAQEPRVVGFDPVVDRIRELIRRSDMVEVDAADGIGIVLYDIDSQGTRAVFMRLRDALCTPIPPHGPGEVSVAMAFGYAASSSVSGRNSAAEETSSAWREEASTAGSSLEVISRAMLHTAWQPHIVLTLTLPALASAAQPAKRTRARRDTGMETAGALPKHRTKEVEPSSSTQAAQASDAADTDAALPQFVTRHGYLRVVASHQVTLPEIEALRALARVMKVPFVRMPAHIPNACRTVVQPAVACELRAVPIGRTGGTLTIAMHDPSDAAAIQRLRALTGLNIFPVLAAPDEIDHALRQIMGR